MVPARSAAVLARGATTVRARLALVALLAFALLGGAAAPALAGGKASKTKYVTTHKGVTALTIDPGTAGALGTLGVKVSALSPAVAFAGRGGAPAFAFPISYGRVEAATLAGRIFHRGGLRFTAGGKSVGVRSFTIDTRTGFLTARVVGTKTRIPLLKIDASGVDVSLLPGFAVLRGISVSLTPQAASALNATFSTSAFTAGLKIGTVEIVAVTRR